MQYCADSWIPLRVFFIYTSPRWPRLLLVFWSRHTSRLAASRFVADPIITPDRFPSRRELSISSSSSLFSRYVGGIVKKGKDVRSEQSVRRFGKNLSIIVMDFAFILRDAVGLSSHFYFSLPFRCFLMLGQLQRSECYFSISLRRGRRRIAKRKWKKKQRGSVGSFSLRRGI